MKNRRILKSLCILAGVMFMCGCHSSENIGKGYVVTIAGEKGHWEIWVNGSPFSIKGVGVGRLEGSIDKADYLKLAKEMGANIVRTWGPDQGTEEYLNKALEYGLYVDAGIWLDPAGEGREGSYASDPAYRKRLKQEILSYVKKYQEHPAILFWNIGNETIFWTKDEKERVAFCKFLEKVIQEVHRIDPVHPVVYTTAFTTAVPYIKKYVPSLDILGINVYGGLEQAHETVVSELDIPYIVTEFGPLGPWDQAKDNNGISIDQTDEVKAYYYKRLAHAIKSFYGYCLGGFAFYLGDTSQVSMTWWNITYGEYPRLSYLTMQAFYKHEEIAHRPPMISDMVFSKRKDLSPGENFEVEVKLRPHEGKVRYEYFASTADETLYFSEYPNHRIRIDQSGDGPKVTLRAPWKPELYRIYGVAIDEYGQASVFNKSIRVSEAGK